MADEDLPRAGRKSLLDEAEALAFACNARGRRLKNRQRLDSSSRCSCLNCFSHYFDWNMTGITPIVVDCPGLINLTVPPYVPLKAQ